MSILKNNEENVILLGQNILNYFFLLVSNYTWHVKRDYFFLRKSIKSDGEEKQY